MFIGIFICFIIFVIAICGFGILIDLNSEKDTNKNYELPCMHEDNPWYPWPGEEYSYLTEEEQIDKIKKELTEKYHVNPYQLETYCEDLKQRNKNIFHILLKQRCILEEKMERKNERIEDKLDRISTQLENIYYFK